MVSSVLHICKNLSCTKNDVKLRGKYIYFSIQYHNDTLLKLVIYVLISDCKEMTRYINATWFTYQFIDNVFVICFF